MLLSEQIRQHYTPLRTMECPTCERALLIEGELCRHCDGFGWIIPPKDDLTFPKVEPDLIGEPVE